MANSIVAASSNLIATQLEKVNPKLQPLLVKQESKFAQMFKRNVKKHRVSAWQDDDGNILAFRVPVLLNIGGDYQVISLDGGDLGAGSLMNTGRMTLAFFATDIGFNIPLQAAMATKTNQQAITNTMEFSIGNAVKETALYNEIGLFQDGTGVLATATSIVSGNGNANTDVVYQLETSAFSFIRLRGKNQLIDVANAANSVLEAGARVKSINFAQNQVTITAGGTGYTPTNTDQLIFPGMAAVNGTISAGSFRNGIYTFNTTNTSGSLLGLAYSSAYELVCPTVNAGGGFYTAGTVFAGKSQIVQRRDDTALDGLIGVCHMAQRTSWYLQGLTIANNRIMTGQAAKSVDLAGQGTGYNDTFEAGDVVHHVSRYANKSRVDWFNPSNFGWVQLDDIGFIQTPEGQRIFIGHSTTTGNPTAGFQFYVHNTTNLYSVDPGTSCVFSSLAIPSGQ